MAIGSGTICLDANIDDTLGLGSKISAYRGKFGLPASGQLCFSQFRGKSLTFLFFVSSDKIEYNVTTAATNAGWDKTQQDLVVNVNSGVWVYSNSTSKAAMVIDRAPSKNITVYVYGHVVGKGGDGGGDGASGGAGGTAIQISGTGQNPKIVLMANGSVFGGGGGGQGASDDTGSGGGGGAGGGAGGKGHNTGATGGAGGGLGGKGGNGGVYNGATAGVGGEAGGSGGTGDTYKGGHRNAGGGGGGRVVISTVVISGYTVRVEPKGGIGGGGRGGGQDGDPGANSARSGGGGGRYGGKGGGTNGGAGGKAISGTHTLTLNGGFVFGGLG